MRYCWAWLFLVVFSPAVLCADVPAERVVTGRVVRPDGTPVVGVPVRANLPVGHPRGNFRTMTDGQGNFRIRGLPRVEVSVSVDWSHCHSSKERVALDETEVVITAIPWDELILARHPLADPLTQAGDRATTTLRGLYRARAVGRDWRVGEECLGLEIETRAAGVEGEPRPSFIIEVTDDRGRTVERSTGSSIINGRYVRLWQLPEADATSLTVKVRHEISGYGNPIVFESVPPMTPVRRDGLALVLGKLELTDERLPAEGDTSVRSKAGPYLRAMVYELRGPRRRHYPVTARPVGDGPELALKHTTPYGAEGLRLACELGGVPAGSDAVAAVNRLWRFGPAWVAGIREGDEIISSDSVTWKSVVEMVRYLREQPVGTTVTFGIRRGEEELDVPVVLGVYEEKFEAEAQQALSLLRDLAGEDATGQPVSCYELQSAGGHGAMPLPEALSVSAWPRMMQVVSEEVFENVPLPEDLRGE